MVRLLALVICALLFTESASADSLFGTILNKDGSQATKVRITTSFDSKVATLPAPGQYRIDFGVVVGRVVKVYINGDTYTGVFVKGNTRLDIRLKK